MSALTEAKAHLAKAREFLEAAELKATGVVGRAQATTFDRLLRLKAKSQYQGVSISASEATKAIACAARMLEAAVGVNT